MMQITELAPALLRPLPDALAGQLTDADWLRLWSRHFANGTALALRDANSFLPLHRESRGGLAKARVLRGLTNGQSQYTPIALDPAQPDQAALQLLSRLGSRRDWDLLHLQGLTENTTNSLTTAARQLGLTVVREHSFANHLTNLADIRDGLLPFPISGDTRRRKERQLRALEREGPVRVSRVIGQDRPTAMQTYLRAERNSWKATSGEVLGDGGAVQRFYDELAITPGTEIWFMHLHDAVIAGLILRRTGGALVGLKCFYDQKFEKFSPATLLCMHMLREALQDPELIKIDWYSGKDSYRIFSTATCQRYDLVIWQTGLRPSTLRRARQVLQQLRAWLKPARPKHGPRKTGHPTSNKGNAG